jgi:phage N-6-adenine-methyltransferase
MNSSEKQQSIHFRSRTDKWSTPPKTFAELDDEFHFELDVCAEPENAKCARFFTKEDNGLKQPWQGVCWCNPPYGRKKERQSGPWIEKAYESSLQGATVVLLIAARTDTQYWHDYVKDRADQIRYLKGRLKFGDAKDSAPFPSAVVVFKAAEEADLSYRNAYTKEFYSTQDASL